MSPASFSGEVAIVGVAYSEVARRSSKTLGQLTVDACTAALEDAGLSTDDVDGISVFPHPGRQGTSFIDGVDVVGADYVAQTMRLRNLRWSCSLMTGMVTGATLAAAHALSVGSCDYVLVWRSMHNPTGKYSQVAQPKVGGAAQFTAPWGFGQNVVSFALPWSRYMAKYGATREQLGTFVVRNRANAAENPNAVFYGRPITLDDYLADRMVAEPLSVLDCDMPVDGCGALVLTTVERARDLKQSPAVIRGGASLGIPPRRSLVLTLENFIESGGQVARALWSSTDLTASDITQAQLYDGFSYFTPMWLEIFGFFPEGEGLLAIQDDTTTRTGKLPINTGGGALGMGRLHGSPQLIEAVLQIQGRAGPRQVADPSVALVHAGSPWHHCAALLLTSGS